MFAISRDSSLAHLPPEAQGNRAELLGSLGGRELGREGGNCNQQRNEVVQVGLERGRLGRGGKERKVG